MAKYISETFLQHRLSCYQRKQSTVLNRSLVSDLEMLWKCRMPSVNTSRLPQRLLQLDRAGDDLAMTRRHAVYQIEIACQVQYSPRSL